MTYNPGIPQPGDRPSQSQAQILTNFGQLNTLFGIDHVEYNDATVANRGKHKKVDFLQVAAPGASASQAVVYAKASSGNTELFLQRDAVGTEIQLTTGSVSVSTNGTTFLPGGLILKYGICEVTGGNAGLIDYTALTPALTAFPTATLSVQLTSINNNIAGRTSNATLTSTSFTISGSAATIGNQYFFLAIGN